MPYFYVNNLFILKNVEVPTIVSLYNLLLPIYCAFEFFFNAYKCIVLLYMKYHTNREYIFIRSYCTEAILNIEFY